jgi:hypothetical protein
MIENETSYIALLIQSTNRIFCYFYLSAITINEFDKLYGNNAWISSTPVLKLFFIENGISKLQETITLDPLANNWYINLTGEDKDVCVEYGRSLSTHMYYPLVVSNIITTPRNHQANDVRKYFINAAVKSPSPPFSNTLKTLNQYPEINISKNNTSNLFLQEYIKNLDINDTNSSH